MTHAKQPQLCPECESVAHSMAELGAPRDAVFQPCRHNGVLALGAKNGQTIVSWNIQGPIAPADFDVFATAMLVSLKQKGIHPHPITQQ